MTRKVTAIPATRNRFTETPLVSKEKRKVAGYARVSTDHEEQTSSYEAQMDYYRNYINSRSDWVFAGMYADEGVTGTSTKARAGFKKMVEDALAGKIDLIITKSVSRFARNTVDSLSTVRKLKENGIEIYFEKENIWTLDAKGELLITIMSSLAQEESRSISENTTWGTRKKMADGRFTLAYSRFLGYDKGEDGQLVINPEQAKTVRLIFRLFLDGLSYKAICNELMKRGIPTPAGKKKWSHSTIVSILTNEKYKGDALLQKTYVSDFLTKATKKNNGEIPQYYVENDHEAIIEPRIFDLVQAEKERRSSQPGKYSGVGIFSSKIKCGCCGNWYGSKVWHSNDKYRRVVYRCNHKYKGDEKCSTPHLTENEIESIFIKAVNALISNRQSVLDDVKIIRDRLCDTSILEKEQTRLGGELEIVADLIEKYVRENASTVLDQDEYKARYEELVERYNRTKDEYDNIESMLASRHNKALMLDNFMLEMKKHKKFIEKFDGAMWSSLVDYITVYSRKDIRVTFRDGTTITINE